MSSTIGRAVFALGLVVGALAAVLIGLDAPEVPEDAGIAVLTETDDFDLLIDLAFSDYDANDSRADSAPQQQVVNGWIARDMLRIIALQNEALADTLDAIASIQAATPADDRPARLLVVLTAVIAWIGLWAAAVWRPASPQNPPSLAEPALASTETTDTPVAAEVDSLAETDLVVEVNGYSE